LSEGNNIITYVVIRKDKEMSIKMVFIFAFTLLAFLIIAAVLAYSSIPCDLFLS
jgi:hypothetical protein